MTNAINKPSSDERESIERQRISRVGQLTNRDIAILRRIGQGQVASLRLLYILYWLFPALAINTATIEYSTDSKRNVSGKGDLSTPIPCLTPPTGKTKNSNRERRRPGTQISKEPPSMLTTARYRLAQLVGSGYLQTTYTNVRRRGEQVYSLTSYGAVFFTPLEQERLFVGMPGTNEMRQQLDAQATRLMLERELVGRNEHLIDWKAERQVRSEAYLARAQREAALGRKLNLQELEALPELPDARATIERGNTVAADTTSNSSSNILNHFSSIKTDSPGKTYQIDIEIDGAYYGAALLEKLAGQFQVCRNTNRPLIWATSSPARATRIAQEIIRLEAKSLMQVLLLAGSEEPATYLADLNSPPTL